MIRDDLLELVRQTGRYGEWLSQRGVRSAPRIRAADDSECLDRAKRLELVRQDLGECTRCKLHQGRTHLVFGTGNPEAKLVFVGEGPGFEEDQRGEPFVGAAGQLLNRMIAAMGLARSDVYIANIVKCRPPRNRTPEPDEVATCVPFLLAQIQAISPEVLVALGKVAAQTLLRTSASISALRGNWHTLGTIPLMPTFHPAFLLRSPERKRDAWQDLQAVMVRMKALGAAASP